MLIRALAFPRAVESVTMEGRIRRAQNNTSNLLTPRILPDLSSGRSYLPKPAAAGKRKARKPATKAKAKAKSKAKEE